MVVQLSEVYEVLETWSARWQSSIETPQYQTFLLASISSFFLYLLPSLPQRPLIYLSIPSHCVCPVDIKYRICVRSFTSLFLTNSSLAKPRVSFLESLLEILRQSRTIVRHSEIAFFRWRNYHYYSQHCAYSMLQAREPYMV